MKFSWRRSQATRLVTIRVNWPAVVGPEWVQPCGYAHTSARGSLLRLLGVVALERGAIIRRQVSRSA